MDDEEISKAKSQIPSGLSLEHKFLLRFLIAFANEDWILPALSFYNTIQISCAELCK